MAVFIRKLSGDMFMLFFLGVIREKRGGKGGRRVDTWSVEYESIKVCKRKPVVVSSNALV